MNRTFIILLLIACFIQSACERDDICAESTPTTPLLVIDFVDADNPVDEKIPVNLGIIEDGETDPNLGRLFNSASISIPLRTNADQTVYQFILNATEEDPALRNTDIVTFTYDRSEEFISKACGFRITYSSLSPVTEGGVDNDWIQNIETINPILVNDTITHVRILH